MYLNIDELSMIANQNISITEMYPKFIDGAVVIPKSKVMDGPVFAFMNVSNAFISDVPLKAHEIMTRANYEQFVNAVERDLKTRNKVSILNSIDTMYAKYKDNMLTHRILGVVFLTFEQDDNEIVPAIDYYPSEAVQLASTRIGLETFWKSLSIDIPNIEIDLSSVKLLYKNYLQKCKLSSDSISVESPLMLSVPGRDQFIELIINELSVTNVPLDQLYQIASEIGEGFENRPEFTPYIQNMMLKYGLTQALSAGYFVYVFESHYQKIYQMNSIPQLFNTNKKGIYLYPEINVNIQESNEYKNFII